MARARVSASSIRSRTARSISRAILERRRGDLDAGVTLLIARETLTADEFAPLRSTVAQQSAAE
jgi:ATP-dependent Zn protease